MEALYYYRSHHLKCGYELDLLPHVSFLQKWLEPKFCPCHHIATMVSGVEEAGVGGSVDQSFQTKETFPLPFQNNCSITKENYKRSHIFEIL